MSNGGPVPGPAAPPDPAIVLGDLLSLAFDAIAVAQMGLHRNPSTGEARALNETLVELQAKRAIIRAKLTAIASASQPVDAPTKEQVAEIGALTAQVEKLTSAATSASAAVAFSSRVLAVATDVAAGAAVPGATGHA
jgi:hypothetical protein